MFIKIVLLLQLIKSIAGKAMKCRQEFLANFEEQDKSKVSIYGNRILYGSVGTLAAIWSGVGLCKLVDDMDRLNKNNNKKK